MFDIITFLDLFHKLEADFADLKSRPDSSRFAFNCIVTAYHLPEWVWGDWLKFDETARNSLGIADFKGFQNWLFLQRPNFSVVRDLTNGAKHFARRSMPGTERIVGYGAGPYGIGPLGEDYLLIDLGADIPAPERYITAVGLVEEAIKYWQTFFAGYRPSDVVTPG